MVVNVGMDVITAFVDAAFVEVIGAVIAAIFFVVAKVFIYFCNDVDDDGLLRMLRVIKKDLKPARRKDANSEDVFKDLYVQAILVYYFSIIYILCDHISVVMDVM
ncbi:unnamed protein product [Amaranthus hypochondriacus]